VGTGGGEFVAADESTIVTKTPLDPIVVENGEVLPIPPGPMRAIGTRFSARSTILSINWPRPKKVLGGNGGGFPRMLDPDVR